MAGDRKSRIKDGYGQSAQTSVSIADTDTGSTDDPVDLGRNYKHVWMHIADCQYIAADTVMTFKRSSRDAGTMIEVHRDDAPGVEYETPILPVTGAFSCRLPVVAFSQRLQPILSNAASNGAVVIVFEGFEAGVGYG